MRKSAYVSILLALTLSSCSQKETQKTTKKNTHPTPNIIIIYTDDLGYGDISANGFTTLLTPNIDKLAEGGIRFTNGYASSATCTPSRYALLTGEYPWKNKNAKILPGTAPMLIKPEQTTIPKMLKSKGYFTGIVGKWHLGLGTGNVNWNKTITPNPNQVGFDYSYIMAATQDRVPTVYIQNGNVVNLDPNDPIEINYEKNFDGQPTGAENPELTTMKWHTGHKNTIVNGIPRIGFMKGGQSAKWNDIDMADNFLKEAKNYVRKHKETPFFLYYAMQQPHVPRTPHPRFKGKSGLGPRGDVILEADWCIGELMKTLSNEGILENTFIIFSSDNGPVLNDGYYDDAVEKLGKHKPSGQFRGGKYSLYDAGTHVPFITYWKGTIKPKVSNALVCQMDLLTSLSNLVGSDLKAKDSENLLEVFLGNSDSGRNQLILEATSRTALRKGNWVMIPPYPGEAIIESVNIEIGNSSEYQLYNLKTDKEQQINLAHTYPEKLEEMKAIFENTVGENYDNIELLELK